MNKHEKAHPLWPSRSESVFRQEKIAQTFAEAVLKKMTKDDSS
jgi:hypothetical protein